MKNLFGYVTAISNIYRCIGCWWTLDWPFVSDLYVRDAFNEELPLREKVYTHCIDTFVFHVMVY